MTDNRQEPIPHLLLEEATQASEELFREVQSVEKRSPHLNLFEGSLLFLCRTLRILQSAANTDNNYVSLMSPLQGCGLLCRNTLRDGQQTRNGEVWMGTIVQLAMTVEGYSYTFMCFLMIRSR